MLSASLRPYADAGQAARAGESTPFTRSLDGRWRFAYADHVRQAPADFAGPDTDISGWSQIEVPGVWQQQGFDRPIYRNVPSEIAPYDPPRVPDDINPVGTYVRDFTIPSSWDGRRQLLRFEGVTSGYFVWVNGEFVGYDQGGMTPAEFDVTAMVHPGRNRIAVRVFRWGSGAYLENFDMWHNAEKHGDGWPGRTGNGTVDDVRVYDRALTPQELAAGADPTGDALLALDFDEVGKRGSYFAYGSSPFLLNGVVKADRTPQPELAQMKYSHAWLRFADIDAAAGQFRVLNDHRFTDTANLEVRWSLVEGNRTLANGSVRPNLRPGESQPVTVSLPPNPNGVQRFLNLDAALINGTPWAPAGHTVSSEQFAAGGQVVPAPAQPPAGRLVSVADDGAAVTVSGREFAYRFDREAGTFTSLRARGTELIERGPVLDVWRAPLGNEWANWGDAEGRRFWRMGLDRLRTTVDGVTVTQPDPATARITVAAHSQAPDVVGNGFTESYVYTVNAAGVLTVEQTVEAFGDTMRGLPWLPRVGFNLRMPERYGTFEWYGRGPGESYVDRWNSQRMSAWRGSVDEQVFDFLPPQETGNKIDVAWAALSDGRSGLLVSGDLEVSVDRFAADRDRANYPFLLRPDGVTFRVDKGVSGLGDTPIPTQPQYRVLPNIPHTQTVVLRPLTADDARHGILTGS